MKTKEYIKITDDGKLKTSELIEKIRKNYPTWCYDEANLDKNFPKPKKSTTRWFNKTQEPDKDLLNKSANDLEKEGIKGITLRERLLMGLAYWEETGEHLDVKGWTLCSGSRDRGGLVPYGSWDGGKSFVYWCGLAHRSPALGSRRAFETDPSTLNLESSDPPVSQPFALTPVGKLGDVIQINGSHWKRID